MSTTSILLILLAVFLIIATLIWRLSVLNQRTQAHKRECDSLLHELEIKNSANAGGLILLKAALAHHQPFADQPPYAEPVSSLANALGNAAAQHEDALRGARELQDYEMPDPDDLASAFLRAGFTHREWKFHAEEYAILVSFADECAAWLNTGQSVLANLLRLPAQWGSALQDLKEQNGLIGTRLAELEQHGCRGEALQAQKVACIQVQKRLGELPLLSARPTAAGVEAQVVTVAAACQELQGGLEASSRQAAAWHEKWSAMDQAVLAMGAAVRTARVHLEQMAPDLDLTGEQARFDALRESALDLHSRSRQAEVEGLEGLAGSSAELEAQVSAFVAALVGLSASSRALTERLGQAGSRLQSLYDQVNAQAAVPEHPVRWDLSGGRLRELAERLQHLLAQGRRTPALVEQDLGELHGHAASLEQLEADVQRTASSAVDVRAARQALRQELASPAPAWLAAAQSLAGSTRSFDPENWSDLGGAPAGLLTEAEHVLRSLADENAVPPDANVPLPESSLETAGAASLGLFAALLAVRQRVIQVQARLDEITCLQATSGASLVATLQALKAFTAKELSNDLIERMPGSLHDLLKNLKTRMVAQGERLLQEISDPQHGRVLIKAARIEAWLKEVQTKMGQAQADVQAQQAELRGKFAACLQQTALYARNATDEFLVRAKSHAVPMLVYAQEVSTGNQSAAFGDSAAGSGAPPSAAQPLEAVIPALSEGIWDLHTLVHDWERMEASYTLLIENQARFDQAQKSARERYAAVDARYGSDPRRNRRPWPPISNGRKLEELKGALGELEARWKQVHFASLPLRQIGFSYELLTREFEKLERQLEDAQKRAAEDQETIQTLFGHIRKLEAAWQAKIDELGSAGAASPELNAILRVGDESRLSGIEDLYHIGSLQYTAIKTELMSIVTQLAEKKVTINKQEIHIQTAALSALHFIQANRDD